MTEQKVSSRYARAILDIAVKESITDNVINDLDSVRDMVNSSKELLNLLHSPVVPDHLKKKVFNELLENRVSDLVKNFIILLIDKGREDLLLSIIERFHVLYDIEYNRVKIYVDSATELTTSLKEKLVTKLQKSTGKTIIPTYNILPEIKGGIRIKVNDWVYDATMKTQLELLRRDLVK